MKKLLIVLLSVITYSSFAQTRTITDTLKTRFIVPKTDSIRLKLNSGSGNVLMISPTGAIYKGVVSGGGSETDPIFGVSVAKNIKASDTTRWAQGGGGTWGTISGDINTQTDLQTQFNTKLGINPLSLNVGNLSGDFTQVDGNSIGVASNKLAINPIVGAGGSAPFLLRTQNKITQNLFEFYNQTRLKVKADSSGTIYSLNDSVVTAQKLRTGTYGHFGGSGGSTYTATAPIKITGTVVSADTGYHKNALVPFYLHQKDSTLAASKLSPNGNGSSLTGITASQVGAATNAAIHDSIAYLSPVRGLTCTGSISLTRKNTDYNDLTLTSNLAFSTASNPITSSMASIYITPNGYTPTFTGMYLTSGSWSTSSSNLVLFWYRYGKTFFSISQPAAQ